jgi:hypothetical protein
VSCGRLFEYAFSDVPHVNDKSTSRDATTYLHVAARSRLRQRKCLSLRGKMGSVSAIPYVSITWERDIVRRSLQWARNIVRRVGLDQRVSIVKRLVLFNSAGGAFRHGRLRCPISNHWTASWFHAGFARSGKWLCGRPRKGTCQPCAGQNCQHHNPRDVAELSVQMAGLRAP